MTDERHQATRREIERLDRLRQNLASGLLEVSAAAKRDAEKLLSVTGEQDTSERAPADAAAVSGWSSPFLIGSFVVGLACGVALTFLLRSPAPPMPAAQGPVVGQGPEVAEAVPASPPVTPRPDVSAPAAVETPSEPPSAPPAPTAPPPAPAPDPGAAVGEPAGIAPAAASGFVLTLTPTRTCWLRSSVDRQEPVERLLPPGRTLVLQVENEASLRIGDAAAMSLLINDQPTRPLGGEGQAVNIRITSTNLQSFLLEPSPSTE